MSGSTDRIENPVHLEAPRERVWQALSDSSRFGTWFGVDFDGPFVEGEKLTGRIAPTKVDPEVAAMQKPHEGTPFEWHREDRTDAAHRLPLASVRHRQEHGLF